MSTTTLHPTPSRQAVVREQFRSVGLVLRREGMLFAGALILFTVLLLVAVIRHGGPTNGSIAPAVLVPLVFLSLFFPLSVWKDETPTRRTYHWAMPVDRTRHTLLRSWFGWTWLMIAFAVYLAWFALLALLSGGSIGIEAAAWQWTVPFTAATVLYLLGSAVVLSSDHPWRWIVGIVVGFGILIAALEAAGLPEFRAGLTSIVYGEFGLRTALTGAAEVSREVVLPNGRRIVREVSRPDFSTWIVATLLWLGLGSAGVILAARRHQER